MREIKFRAWDKKEKKIYSWRKDFGSAYIYDGMRTFIQDLKKQYILMQYVGLEDKNRKEIYEGDIVQLSINNELPHHKGVIKYLPPRFFVMDGNKSGLLLTDKYEVIGNIYENPELLNPTL